MSGKASIIPSVKMEEMGSEIAIWPAENNSCSRQMTFLFGEARWYLWMQEIKKQDVLSLQRDLLMLHQNGDLELCRGKSSPSVGSYITALHDGRMIRGRVYNPDNRSDKSGIIHVIDIDEGKHLQVPANQVRLLPSSMKRLPCQAVRCDVGLHCIELFNWPSQLNDMLHKALRGALFYVENTSTRPGSIPTISAKITICYPNTGQCIDMQKWLLQFFSPHLDLCSLENYKPFPVGMAANLMAHNMGYMQHQMLSLALQSYPPGLAMPNQFGMLPAPSLMLTSNSTFPSLSPMLQSLSPSTLSLDSVASNRFFPSPTDSGRGTSWNSSSATTTPAPPAPSVPLPQPLFIADSSFTRAMSISNTSLSSTALCYESDYSQENSSTVEVDLDVNSLDSNSSTSASSSAAPLPLRPKQQSALNTSSHRSPKIGKPNNPNSHGRDPSLSPVLSCGRGQKRHSKREDSSSSSSNAEALSLTHKGKSIENARSSSSLNADAHPFTLVRSSKEDDIQSSSSNLSVDAPTFTPKSSPHNMRNAHSSKKDIKYTSPVRKELAISDNREASVIGNSIELVQINRDWKVGQVVPVLMARVWNPSCFEVNVIDVHSAALSSMQEEMNAYYASHRITISSKQEAKDLCGTYCACYDPDEKIWFRAEVHEWSLNDSVTPVRVWAVDYGGYTGQDLGCIQPLSAEFCSVPILVTLCAMQNIRPKTQNNIWPEIHLNRVKELLPEDQPLYIRIDGPKSDKDIWPVSLFTDPSCSLDSINEILVAEGCAVYSQSLPAPVENAPIASQNFEDFEDPMEEAFKKGGDNYEYDDEDACVAVSGYKPNDEVGICWFYQREGYCYKKYCDLKHIRLNEDGLTQEKSEVYTEAFENIGESVIAPGKCIKLAVSRILTVHHFIAKLYIKSGTDGIQSRETLSSVLKNLNSTQMKRSLKTFTEYPADGEVVLAKDEDGIFYRGRIICSDAEDESKFEVLNVDTGILSLVSLQNLRRVDPAFLHHPFQAIECWLADVTPVQTDRDWVKTCNAVFAEIVQGQKLKATVVRSGTWGVEVNLFNKEGQDIAVILKEMNIVKDCPMRHIPRPSSRVLPG